MAGDGSSRDAVLWIPGCCSRMAARSPIGAEFFAANGKEAGTGVPLALPRRSRTGGEVLSCSVSTSPHTESRHHHNPACDHRRATGRRRAGAVRRARRAVAALRRLPSCASRSAPTGHRPTAGNVAAAQVGEAADAARLSACCRWRLTRMPPTRPSSSSGRRRSHRRRRCRRRRGRSPH